MTKTDRHSAPAGRIFRAALAVALLLACLCATARAETVDVMLVYDTSASTWVASNGGMSTFTQEAVNRMNQAMQNSGVDLVFRGVHSMSVDYTHTNLDSDLDYLVAGTGNMAAVHAARDSYGADIVAMMVDTGSAYGTVGLGYLLTSWSGNADYAFNVCAIRSVDISETLTHEVGHNFGADHSKYQADSPGPNTYLPATYSAGWYFTGTDAKNYNTVMAYGNDGFGQTYIEAPLFSSPLATYQGATAGDAQDGDNARLLRETMPVIAAYRAAVSTASPSLVGPIMLLLGM